MRVRLSPCVLVQPDGWARGEREGYGGPCDVTSLSLNEEVKDDESVTRGVSSPRGGRRPLVLAP